MKYYSYLAYDIMCFLNRLKSPIIRPFLKFGIMLPRISLLGMNGDQFSLKRGLDGAYFKG